MLSVRLSGSTRTLSSSSGRSLARFPHICRTVFVCSPNNNNNALVKPNYSTTVMQAKWHAVRSFSTTTATPSPSPPLPSSSSSEDAKSQSEETTRRRTFGPDFNSDPLGSDAGIAWWLFGCSALVFGMVSLGGLTRLTKSGLSMVEWKPTTFVPPRTEAEWKEEFEKYQQFPEYKRVNNQMSLEEFKFIYRMEFYHRLLGRTVGIAFAVPGLYFLARGRINKPLGARLAIAFLAGGTQGAIGWWMVKSGLENPHAVQQTGSVHVSPYRLATHLISAFAIYALLFSTAIRVYPSTFSGPMYSNSTGYKSVQELFNLPQLRSLRKLGVVTTVAVAATVFSGAFVAGNEAGLVYNEFPLMGGRIVPQDLINPYIHPEWRNAFENSTMVQFNHRVLAIGTTGLIIATFIKTRQLPRIPAVASLMSETAVAERISRIKKAGHAWIGMASIQVTLGISTLLLYVPVSLATLHQAGSLMLLTFSLVFLQTMRRPASVETMLRLIKTARSKSTVGREISSSVNDLSKGKVHKGTVLLATSVLLLCGVALSSRDLIALIKREKEKAKRKEELKLVSAVAAPVEKK